MIVSRAVPTDAQLCAAWAAGDRGAGQALVDRHLVAILRFFANKVVRDEDVGDLVSQTFERVAGTLGRFRGQSSVRTYLYGIAHNVLREYLAQRRRGSRAVDLETTALRDLGPSVHSIAAQRQERALLLNALRAIPIHAQIVLELSYFEGLGRAEIAEVLAVPEGTVASRIRRGRAQLQAALQSLSRKEQVLAATTRELRRWMDDIQAMVGEDGERIG